MKIKINTLSVIFILGIVMTLVSCDEGIIGSGRIVKETREVKSFDAIDVSGAFHVFITQGDTESLEIEADDNLIQYVESYVRGGTLYLETRGFAIRSATMKAYITVQDLEQVNASGAVKITGESPLEFGRLEIDISGAADIDMEVYGDKLDLKVSGAGKTHLNGEVETMNIRLSGASKLNAEALYAKKMDIDISGAGSARVNVEEELTANISGAGNVRYLGDPKVHSKVSGAGNVKRLD